MNTWKLNNDRVFNQKQILAYFDDGAVESILEDLDSLTNDLAREDLDFVVNESFSQGENGSKQFDYYNNEVSDAQLMPHELVDKLQSEHGQMLAELLLDNDPASDDLSSNDVNYADDDSDRGMHDSSNDAKYEDDAEMQSVTHDSLKERWFGWTKKDNIILGETLLELLTACPAETGQRVTWREIITAFNEKSVRKRTKVQLYSHYRYCFGSNRKPSYLKAEEEMILALDEIGVPPSLILPFLMNERCERMLTVKLQRLKASNKATARKGSHEAHFRKRVQDIVKKNGGLAAIQSNKIPQKVVIYIRHLVKTNPNLRKKYLAIKKAGRPMKKTKMVPVTLQLKTLFRPFVYVAKRRKRTTCYSGDARRYGLNLFCLNRLLGSPLELSRMPSGYDEALEAGVENSDYPQYSLLRELMMTHARKRDSQRTYLPQELQEIADLKPEADNEDRNNYYLNPERPPAVSVLPPTLYTVTGLRGLLCYRETLKAIVAEEADDNRSIINTADAPLGDEESDEKLLHFMTSMFQMPFLLNEVYNRQEPGENSDGDSDSDEDVCFSTNPPVSVENQPEGVSNEDREILDASSNCSRPDEPVAQENAVLIDAETRQVSTDFPSLFADDFREIIETYSNSPIDFNAIIDSLDM